MYQPLGSSHTNNEGQADGRAGRRTGDWSVFSGLCHHRESFLLLVSFLKENCPAVGYKRICATYGE